MLRRVGMCISIGAMCRGYRVSYIAYEEYAEIFVAIWYIDIVCYVEYVCVVA